MIIYIFLLINIILGKHYGCTKYCNTCKDKELSQCEKCIDRAFLVSFKSGNVINNISLVNNSDLKYDEGTYCNFINEDIDCLYPVRDKLLPNHKRCWLCKNNKIPTDISINSNINSSSSSLKMFSYITKCINSNIINCGKLDNLTNTCLVCLNNTVPSLYGTSCINVSSVIKNCLGYQRVNNIINCYFCKFPYFISKNKLNCQNNEKGWCVRTHSSKSTKICRECENNYYLDTKNNICIYINTNIFVKIILIYLILFK